MTGGGTPTHPAGPVVPPPVAAWVPGALRLTSTATLTTQLLARGLRLGSAGHQLLNHAACPVAVVRTNG